MQIERILITGGSGFIGSHTADLLLSQGKQVVVLDNLFSGKLENLNLSHPDLEFIEGDILEFHYLKELIASCDAVIHLAAIASVPYSIENPIYSFQVNTQGFLHVVEAIRQLNRRTRLVYASSAAVYGNEKILPCDDAKALSSPPLSPYALQKIQTEEYANLYERLHGISSVGLRYFNVYGERQDPASPYSGVITRFLDAYQAEKPLTILGDGEQSRDFIHVSDVAKANLLALESEVKGVLNIATGVPQTLLQLIDYIRESGKKTVELSYLPERLGDIKMSYARTALAQSELGFKFSVSLKEGICQLVPETTR